MLPTAMIRDVVISVDGAIIALGALIAFVALNLISFVEFYLDKRKSIMKRRRTPESKLLLLSALGPFGAYIGMKIFRHKTRKLKFQLVPLFAVVHLFLAAVILL